MSVRFYGFDRFTVDTVKRLLLRDGAPVPLTPKAFDILVLLIQRRDTVVDKDDIFREVWHGTVVEENNLARNISTLRKALDDVPGQHRFIVTIPGRGYQFVGDVEEAGSPLPHVPTAPAPVPVPPEPPAPAIGSPPPPPGRPRSRYLMAAAGLLLLASLPLAYYLMRDSPPPPGEPSSATHQIWQLTFASGLQGEPSWSPDGRMVAFSSDRSGNLDIWIQAIDGGNPIQVTTSSAHDWQPDWSPDGGRLVFRSERGRGGLYVVPVLGGPEQPIADFGYHARWSPDGTRLLFHRTNFQGQVQGARELYTVALDGRPPRKMLAEFLDDFGSLSTAWHPDSQRISVWGPHDQSGPSFWTAPLDGTAPPVKSEVAPAVKARFAEALLRFSDADGLPLSFLWAPSGDALYFEGTSRGVRNLWKVDVDPATLVWRGGPTRLTTGADVNAGLSVSRDGGKLAFAVRADRIRLWSFGIDPTSGRAVGAGEPITTAAFDALTPVLSRDGAHLLFGAERGGNQEIWRKASSDGKETLVVPADNYRRVSPVWSYDNNRVMYLRTTQDGDVTEGEIVTVPASGGQEQVLRTAEVERLLDWSADGLWILGAARRRAGVPYELIVLPADAANGAERRVLATDSESNLWKARLSADQRWVAFTAPTGPGASAIYVVPFNGGNRINITTGDYFDDRPRWAPDGRLVYFLSSRSGFLNVWARRFNPKAGIPVGEPFSVTELNDPAKMIPPRTVQLGLAVSRDRLIIPIAAASGDIWVLEGLNR